MLKPKHLVIGGAVGYGSVILGLMIVGEWSVVAPLISIPSFVALGIGLIHGGGDRWR